MADGLSSSRRTGRAAARGVGCVEVAVAQHRRASGGAVTGERELDGRAVRGQAGGQVRGERQVEDKLTPGAGLTRGRGQGEALFQALLGVDVPLHKAWVAILDAVAVCGQAGLTRRGLGAGPAPGRQAEVQPPRVRIRA